MSFKKIAKRFTRAIVKVLNFFTYNKIVKRVDFLLTMFVFAVWIIHLFINIPLLYIISNILWSVIVIHFLITLYWEMYNDKVHIEKLEVEIEDLKMNEWIYDSNLEDELAALAHDIWCRDFKEDNRSKLSFNELTIEEQEVNKLKAIRMLKVIKSYV